MKIAPSWEKKILYKINKNTQKHTSSTQKKKTPQRDGGDSEIMSKEPGGH